MKQITALLMAIMLTLCLLKVKGGDASVVFNLEGGNGVNAVPLTVSLAVNGGISGASVNIIYDYKKVKLAGWEKGAALNCDIISVDENGYHFRFEKLVRWIEMCKRSGVKYYEIAHLFSQWGAKYAPQISAWRGRVRSTESPLHTDTAKASIESPTASMNSSRSDMAFNPPVIPEKEDAPTSRAMHYFSIIPHRGASCAPLKWTRKGYFFSDS